MPTYVFKCPVDDELIELSVQISEVDGIVVLCGCGRQMKQKYTAPGVTFKGTGFYRNDSRPPPKSEKSS